MRTELLAEMPSHEDGAPRPDARAPSPPAPLPQAGEGRVLPSFDAQVSQIAAAERGEGWLATCADAGRFLVLTRQFAAALVRVLHRIGRGPVLEIAAGRGELATALAAAGIPVVTTDVDAPAGSPVERASAEGALRRYRPAVVLGSFVPVDSTVDAAVQSFPSVRHYVVLSARIGGLLGSPALWQTGGWTARPLDEVTRWMLTRHDVWLGETGRPVLQHGEAWHLSLLGEDP